MADWVEGFEDEVTVQYDHAVALTEVELAHQRRLMLGARKVPSPEGSYICDDCFRRFICKLVFEWHSSDEACLWEQSHG